MVFFYFLSALTAPTVTVNEGSLWMYPLYAPTWLQCFYSTGTWLWLYLIVYLHSQGMNHKYNDSTYQLTSSISMYAYLIHYPFIVIVSAGIVKPLGIPFVPAIFVIFFATIGLIWISYKIGGRCKLELARRWRSKVKRDEQRTDE